MINGTTVILHVKRAVGTDDFGTTVYTSEAVTVNNVIIGEPTTEEVTTELALSGKRLAYTLAIPKGDTNVWEDTEVEFFGMKFRTFGFITQGIEENIPLFWNKKIKVERYE